MCCVLSVTSQAATLAGKATNAVANAVTITMGKKEVLVSCYIIN